MPLPPVTPWPAPAGAPALLFGGTFDPPHRAHVDLAVHARDAAMPAGAWLVVVPAARSPFKDGPPAATDAQRVDMLRLALGDVPRAAVWTDELDRAAPGVPSYWIETLRRAREVAGAAASLRFLMGADQAVKFHQWRDHRGIAAIAEPLVLLREPLVNRAALADALEGVPELRADVDAWLGRVVDAPVRPTSSTRIRDGTAEPGDLHPLVAGYIAEHGLYPRVRPTS